MATATAHSPHGHISAGRGAARCGTVAGRRRQTRPAPTLICLTYNSGRVQDISQLPICFMTLLKGLQHPRRFFHELGDDSQQDVLISTPLPFLLRRRNTFLLLLTMFTWSTNCIGTFYECNMVIGVYYILSECNNSYD